MKRKFSRKFWITMLVWDAVWLATMLTGAVAGSSAVIILGAPLAVFAAVVGLAFVAILMTGALLGFLVTT